MTKMTLDLSECRKIVDGNLAKLNLVREQIKAENQALVRADKNIKAVELAQRITQHIAQSIQQRIYKQIAAIVTRCLQAVFDEPYDFQLRFDRKRGKTECRMVFVRGGKELDDPLNEIGGGVVEVAAFGLRVACLLLSRPSPRRFLALDEPFKSVRGDEYRDRVRQMLLALSEELGIQILLNTDLGALQLGTVIEIG